LAGFDFDAIDAEGISALPVMTKDDLMGHFDDIVTDERLRLRVVEDHLAGLTSAAYLFDRYHAVASGGSSGRRGVIVFDWDGWATCFWSLQRLMIRAIRIDPAMAGGTARMAFVAAGAATHVTTQAVQTFSTPGNEMHRFPIGLPTTEIVAGLNALQPTMLLGYPSALHPLAVEARAGRLRISPSWIYSLAEPLLPETREALEEAFGVPVGNFYGMSEAGAVAGPCRSGRSLHLAEDLVIVEPVDVEGRPVPPGVRSDKIYVTNLWNHALPLIRYEVTDQIELLDEQEPCPCGCTHRRIADPYGRLDDGFRYGQVAVHPSTFRTPLGRHREIVEYQVRQTPAGAAIAVRACGPLDTAPLAAEIAAELAALGVSTPRVDIDVVDSLPRPPSGKLARFVAIPARP
jgi:phenylacetate-coenzyme A ligase PaaK-like adenylate-forming protein